MVSKEPVHVRIVSDHDVARALDAVRADSVPRVVERDGKAVAAIVSIDDLERLIHQPTAEDIALALESAGGWKDLGGEDMAEKIFRWRHESPERPAVQL